MSEPKDGMNSWLLRSSHEEQEDHPWPQVSSQGSSKRMKQLELSFSRILEPSQETEDEHARSLDGNPNKLHDEAVVVSSPYIKKTGKMTKKEMKEQASKNKSVLLWTRENDNIPVGRREDEHLDHDCDENVPIVTGIVIASTDRPGWKSSQAGRPGSEPEAVAEDDWTGICQRR